MPGLAQGNNGVLQFGNGATASSLYSLSCSNGSANGFWSKHRDVVSYNQLQKVYINTYKELYGFFFLNCICLCIVELQLISLLFG